MVSAGLVPRERANGRGRRYTGTDTRTNDANHNVPLMRFGNSTLIALSGGWASYQLCLERTSDALAAQDSPER